MIRRVIAGLLLATASLGFAQEAQEQEEKREFSVELIVFAYTADVGTGSEIFLPEKPAETDGFELPEFIDTAPLEVDERPAAAERYLPDFTLIPDGEFTLQAAADRMRRLDVYDILLHAGWTQQALPEADAMDIRLDMIAPTPPGLDGSFKLYLSRFLHLVVDLELDARDDAQAPVAVERPIPRSFGSVLPNERDLTYRIREDRIFKSGELRYFDHPKFGVLAQVSRYEPPEIDDDAGEPSPANASAAASD